MGVTSLPIYWLDYPASVRPTSELATVVAFTALVVGSDFALAPFVNIKLMDTLVFIVAFVFGLRAGAAVAVLSELVWSFVSPWGAAGPITPFLVGGELVFALVGWWASRVWGGAARQVTRNSVYFGAVMLACAFVWDFETNAVTALLAYWPSVTFQKLVVTEVLGIPFAIVHEGVDFLLGLLVVPAAIIAIPRLVRGRI